MSSENKTPVDKIRESLPASALAIITTVEGFILGVGNFTTENDQAIILWAILCILIVSFLDKYGIKSTTKRPVLAIVSTILAFFYAFGIWGNYFWSGQDDKIIPVISSIIALVANAVVPNVKDL